MDQLSDEQLKEFEAAFKLFDRDNDGLISIRELGTVMRAIGQNPTDIELQEMINEVDHDKDNAIDFNEFVTMMVKTIHDVETEERTLEAFRVFDRDKSGVMRIAELKHIMMTLGESMPEEQVDELLKLVKQEDGLIDYVEFVKSIFGANHAN
jgi:calmodulin